MNNERIKNLRKSTKLSQTEFGKRLGVSRDVIANLELGRAELPETLLKLMCNEFGASRIWLETGDGEMFEKKTFDEELAFLLGDMLGDPDGDFKKRFIAALIQLDNAAWDEIERFCRSIIDDRKKEKEDGA